MPQSYDWRRIRTHRPYTVETLATLYDINPATVRRWIKHDGLDAAIISRERPLLMSGKLIREWMREKQTSRKQPCGPNEVYCVACKEPRQLRKGTAHIIAQKPPKITLEGECDVCGLTLRRFSNVAHRANLEASFGLKAAKSS